MAANNMQIDMKELTAFINSNKRKSSKSRKRTVLGKKTATVGEDAYIDQINNQVASGASRPKMGTVKVTNVKNKLGRTISE